MAISRFLLFSLFMEYSQDWVLIDSIFSPSAILVWKIYFGRNFYVNNDSETHILV